jgi:S-adenosylmethionine/arginine decarboxylase-like enzyme
MGTQGISLLLEFWGCRSKAVGDGVEMSSVVHKAVAVAGYEVVHSAFRRFDNGGVGGFVTGYDGHLAVRSWPASGHVMVDMYSCSPKRELRKSLIVLVAGLKSQSHRMQEISRGVEGQAPMVVIAEPESGMLSSEVNDDGM